MAYLLAICDTRNCVATNLDSQTPLAAIRLLREWCTNICFLAVCAQFFFIPFVPSFSGMVFMMNAYGNMEMPMCGSISLTYLTIYPSQHLLRVRFELQTLQLVS